MAINLTADSSSSFNFGTLLATLNLTALPPATSTLRGQCDVTVSLESVGFISVIVGKLDIDVELNAIPKSNGTGETCLTADDLLPTPSSGTRKNRWFV